MPIGAHSGRKHGLRVEGVGPSPKGLRAQQQYVTTSLPANALQHRNLGFKAILEEVPQILYPYCNLDLPKMALNL